MLSEGIAGQDLFSGRQLGSFERASNVLAGGFGLFTAGWGGAFGEAGSLAEAGGLCGVSGNSFVAGTLVDSEKGQVAIETLKVGDKVWAEDPTTGESGYHVITYTTNHTADEVVQLTLGSSSNNAQADSATLPDGIALASTLGSIAGSASGASPGDQQTQDKTDSNSTSSPTNGSTLTSETIEATAQHPFWVEGKGWVNAGDLVVGDKLRTKDGYSTVEVKATKRIEKQAQVYNFTVEGLHTYFVGQQQVLVHNTGNCLTPELFNETDIKSLETKSVAINRDAIGKTEVEGGIIYVLKDKNSGELLKVGQGTKIDRLIDYVGPAKFTKRELVADFFTVSASTRKELLPFEEKVRSYFTARKERLPWDNTIEEGGPRLGRPGPGIPGINTGYKKYEGYYWKGETWYKPDGTPA